MMTLVREIPTAARALFKTPGITTAAVVTLALGIGATTAMFSIAYGVLVRPLPYRASSSLAVITAEATFGGQTRRANYSAVELDGWRERSRAFESIALWGNTGYGLRTESGLESVTGTYVSPAFFSTLDEPLALGRAINAGDDRSPVAVIAHRLWISRFGGDEHAIGRSIRLNGRPYTVIGVTRPDFAFPTTRTVVWTPLGHARALGEQPWLNHPRGGGFNFVARVRPGLTLADARADADATARTLSAGFADTATDRRPLVIGLTEWVAGGVQRAFVMLSAAVLLMLLVTYANVINLVLARHASRVREVAVRMALGAGRRRLLAYSTAESVLIAGAGAVMGILIAMGSVRVLLWLGPAWLPRIDDVRVDTPVLVFAVVLSAVTAVVCATAAWIQQGRADVMMLLRSTAASQAATPTARRFQSALVVAEVAISVVLLVGALLLGRSLVRLLQSDIGVATDHVLAAQLNLTFGRELTEARQTEIVDRLAERIGALPQMVQVGAGTSLPPDAARHRYTLRQVPAPTGETRDFDVDALAVTPGFFSTLRVPLVSGRFFSDGDTLDAPPVMIMSVDTARRFFGEAVPLGRTLSLPSTRRARGAENVALVGIVGNVKYGGLEAAADGGIYRPYAQQPMPSVFVIGRTTGDPLAAAADVRRAVAAVDPDVCVDTLAPLDGAVSRGIAEPRFRAVLLGSIAAVALALACIGLYGILAYSVSQRIPEIGVRMALGATPARVTAMVLRQGLVLACTGLVLGAGAAYLLGRLLDALLFGIASTDPVSFVAASACLLAVATIASYLPARRAARLDPLVSLRAE